MGHILLTAVVNFLLLSHSSKCPVLIALRCDPGIFKSGGGGGGGGGPVEFSSKRGGQTTYL